MLKLMHICHKNLYYKQKIANSKSFKEEIPNYYFFNLSKKKDILIFFFPCGSLNNYTA